VLIVTTFSRPASAGGKEKGGKEKVSGGERGEKRKRFIFLFLSGNRREKKKEWEERRPL